MLILFVYLVQYLLLEAKSLGSKDPQYKKALVLNLINSYEKGTDKIRLILIN